MLVLCAAAALYQTVLPFHQTTSLVSTMGDSAYSFSLTTFSRTGKLLQIEYALNAVANGRTALGICAVDGVVLATDKKLPSVLVDSDEVHKIETITPSTGFCYSGVGPDYRVLGKTILSGTTDRAAGPTLGRLADICSDPPLTSFPVFP